MWRRSPRPSWHSRPRTIGKIYELTEPRSQDMHALAAEYADALGRPITYVDVPFEAWRNQELRRRQLPDHVFEHLLTMARLHAANRYDCLTHDVEAITGRPATSARDFVARHAEVFGPNSRSPKTSGPAEPHGRREESGTPLVMASPRQTRQAGGSVALGTDLAKKVSLARGTRSTRLRRTRYIGLLRVHLGRILSAVGLYVLRLGE